MLTTIDNLQPVKKSLFRPNGAGKLDKLEHLTQAAPNKGLKSLNRRAKTKFLQAVWVKSLVDLGGPLSAQYLDTLKCSCSIKQKGEKFTSRYCGHRWCLICNRIRTAKLINAYEKPLDALTDKQFVTLTRPNVPGEKLKSEIDYFYKWWRSMLRVSVKEGLNLSGIRKLEITYNHKRNDYHPHFHLIVEGKEGAKYILDKWMQANQTASIDAQDIRDCFSYKDLFKYVTKLTTKIQRGPNEFDYFNPEAIDHIFQTIKGARIYQGFGSVKKVKVSEEIETEQALEIKGEEGENVFKWVYNTWLNVKTDEPLTTWEPDEEIKKYRKRIIFTPPPV